MTNQDPPQFVPFAPQFQPPQTESPPLQPGTDPDVNNKPRKETKKQKLAREKREAAAAKKAAAEQVPNKPPKPPRKRKVAAVKTKRATKYDLQTILKIAATLKEGDSKVFEKMLGELSALAKGSRERVLKALGEVFG